MTLGFLRILAGALLTLGLSCAGTINSLHVQLGSWNGSSFTPDGSDWNTYNAENWAIGATLPGFGNPLLNGFNSVSLTDGEYYLYMASNNDLSATAVQITLGYSSGSVAEVFTDASGAGNTGTYTLVSGSGFTANLVTGPQTLHTTVGHGQTYTSTGVANWVIDLDSASVPEPGSWILLFAGLCGMTLLRRKRLAQSGD